VNLGSGLRDHTSYWQNRDEFVALVVEKLLAFEGAQSIPPVGAPETAFLRGQRGIRVGVRRTLGWATTLCVALLLIRYRSEWLAVAAWASHRGVAWIGNVIGVASQNIAVPESWVWRRSVGWLTAVLIASWLARVLWGLWNRAAMEDAERGRYRTQEPLGVLLVLFLELWMTGVAVATFNGWAFAVAGLGVLAVLIAVAVAHGRHPAPKGIEMATSEPSTSSAIVAGRALLALGFLLVEVVAVPGFFVAAAQTAQRTAAVWFGTGWSWVVAIMVLLVGGVLSVALIRATLKAYSGSDDEAGASPPVASP
jgi:hypothetical protein